MKTQLNLLRANPGTFTGRNLVYSGPGYQSMHFIVSCQKDERSRPDAERKAVARQLKFIRFRPIEYTPYGSSRNDVRVGRNFAVCLTM